MTTLRQAQVTFDARNAAALARFWADALQWEVEPGASQWVARVGGPAHPEGSLPLLFIHVPEAKAGKTRIHLDLHSMDLPAELERLVGLGATIVHEKCEWGVHWFTLQDPEGNEFCLAEEAPSGEGPPAAASRTAVPPADGPPTDGSSTPED